MIGRMKTKSINIPDLKMVNKKFAITARIKASRKRFTNPIIEIGTLNIYKPNNDGTTPY
jgi:hypothetical protein